MLAYLMYQKGMTVDAAYNFSNKRRRRIDPRGDVLKLLNNFADGLYNDPNYDFRHKYDAQKDLTEILKSCPKEKP